MMIMCTIARWNTQILDKELAVVNLETFYDREDKREADTDPPGEKNWLVGLLPPLQQT
jgi:hypothetical protein